MKKTLKRIIYSFIIVSVLVLGIRSIDSLAEYGPDDVGYTFYTDENGLGASQSDTDKKLKVVVTGINPKTVSIGQINAEIFFGNSGEYVLPSSVAFDDAHVYCVTEISENAFKDNSSLGKVSIPEGITQIDRYAFYGCKGLSAINLPESLTDIGDYAFEGSGLVNVTIPQGVNKIGNCVFEDCSALSSITIPEGVTSIGMYAFEESGLTSVIIPKTVTFIGTGAFASIPNLKIAMFPDCATFLGENVLGTTPVVEEVIIYPSGATLDLKNVTTIYGALKLGVEGSKVKNIKLYPAYKVSDAIANGSLSVTPIISTDGIVCQLNAVPNSGYYVEDVLYNDFVLEAVNGSYSLALPSISYSPESGGINLAAIVFSANFAQEGKKYNVSFDTCENGTATASSYSAALNENVTLSANPSAGYRFKEWSIVSGRGSLSSTTNSETTYTMGTSDVKLKAVFEEIPYTVSFDTLTNGTASADKTSAIKSDTVTLTASPALGYEFEKWEVVSGEVSLSSTTTNPATFTMGTSDVKIKATFKAIDYSVSVGTIANGTVEVDKSTANIGDNVKLEAKPNLGYKFEKWEVAPEVSGQGSISSLTDNPATYTMGASDVAISATFAKIPYSVTLVQPKNGTISTDKASTTIGEIVTLTATPNSEYRFGEWEVVSGGVTLSNEKDSTTTFTMGTSNVEVKAIFEAIPKYTVSFDPMTNGSAKAEPETAKEGDTVTITATPAEGYKFDGWLVEAGGVTLADESATSTAFTMKTSDVTISALFSLIPPDYYGIYFESLENGTAVADLETAKKGDVVTITATPADGYKFVKWEVEDGGVTLSDEEAAETTFAMGIEDVKVKAVFEAILYTVSFDSLSNGTAATDKASATKGETVKITATPKNGYQFDGWTVKEGGVSLANENATTTTFTMGTDNVKLSAAFSLIPPTYYGIYFDTFENGTAIADKTSATKDETVILTAIPSKGYSFKEWKVVAGNVSLLSQTSATTSFTMNNANVKIKAVFEEKKVIFYTDLDGSNPSESPEGKALVFEKTDKGEVSVGAADRNISGSVSIPDVVTDPEGDNYQVTSLADEAFWGCVDIISITLPDGLTTIGDEAFFSCEKLSEIIVPSHVGNIGNNAFYSCVGLSYIKIPTSVNEISPFAFFGCNNLSKVVIYSVEGAKTKAAFDTTYKALSSVLGSNSIYVLPYYQVDSNISGGRLEVTSSENEDFSLSCNLLATPNEGYRIDSVSVDDEPIKGVDGKYTYNLAPILYKDYADSIFVCTFSARFAKIEETPVVVPASKDYLNELRTLLTDAIKIGGKQTITWDKGTSLPYDVMKLLEDNPNVTLRFNYTYQNVDYRVIISGMYAKADSKIPWYGPLYLYKYYGEVSVSTPDVKTPTATKHTYTVVKGDTLTGIAKRFNTTVKELVIINNIKDPDLIRTRQILKY